MIRRAGLRRFALAMLSATDYTHDNNILSLQMVGRWPTFLLPEDQSPAIPSAGGQAGGNG
jgi:hypothetical protein